MVLHDLRLRNKAGSWDIHLQQDKISSIVPSGHPASRKEKEFHIDLNGGLALPGFINSHDHLDFDLFPMLGERIYNNYREWGPAIREEHKELIKRIQKIPVALRVKWGLYKNLLNGFTTVVHHGSRVDADDDLIHVLQNMQSLHSVGFEKNWKWKLNNPLKIKKQVVIHAGEGTDQIAAEEIDSLIRYNYLKRKIIAVHGVAMTLQQAKKLEALIWCPATNYFMLKKTAPVDQLKSQIKVVFGTDSTLTSPWNSWEHFRKAMDSKMVTEDQLLEMLTTKPAELWELETGRLEENKIADLVILEKSENIFDQNPSGILLVIVDGNIQLIDERLLNQAALDATAFTRIKTGNCFKLIKGDLKKLSKETLSYFKQFEAPFDII